MIWVHCSNVELENSWKKEQLLLSLHLIMRDVFKGREECNDRGKRGI